MLKRRRGKDQQSSSSSSPLPSATGVWSSLPPLLYLFLYLLLFSVSLYVYASPPSIIHVPLSPSFLPLFPLFRSRYKSCFSFLPVHSPLSSSSFPPPLIFHLSPAFPLPSIALPPASCISVIPFFFQHTYDIPCLSVGLCVLVCVSVCVSLT